MPNDKHFEVSILDPDKLVKVNDLQEISNPIFFIRDGIPTSDGLLSNEIFGISKDQRANIFAYIDLSDWFIDPFTYKIWCTMDRRIRDIVHGTKYFIINDDGDFEENDKGKTGIKFLKDNINKIKIRTTESEKRDVKIQFIEENKKNIFINKYIVIPAFYRDVNTSQGSAGVGEINQLYDALLIAVRGLKETTEYGLGVSEAAKGRVQEILLQIYNWFASEPRLAKKYGIIRQAVMSKTVDYGSRLVLSAPQLKCESMEDMFVDLDHSAVPLSSLCVNFLPFMIHWIRNFFENEFLGVSQYPYINKKGEIDHIELDNPLMEFSDDRIKKEIDRFIHGYSNRFIPIKIPNKKNINLKMRFKGNLVPSDKVKDPGNTPLLERDLTWCDIFYMAAVEVTKDKHVIITRYPMDSSFNQFVSKIVVSSTKDTEPMFVNNKVYSHYPKIRQEDIGKDTSNKFVDTLNISNLYLKSITGDYKMVTL